MRSPVGATTVRWSYVPEERRPRSPHRRALGADLLAALFFALNFFAAPLRTAFFAAPLRTAFFAAPLRTAFFAADFRAAPCHFGVPGFAGANRLLVLRLASRFSSGVTGKGDSRDLFKRRVDWKLNVSERLIELSHPKFVRVLYVGRILPVAYRQILLWFIEIDRK